MNRVRRKFGMVFQYAALLDSMTVLDNVAFPLREHTKLSEKEISDRVIHKLSELGLENVGALFPSELSGGMRKRVGLARALMLEPTDHRLRRADERARPVHDRAGGRDDPRCAQAARGDERRHLSRHGQRDAHRGQASTCLRKVAWWPAARPRSWPSGKSDVALRFIQASGVDLNSTRIQRRESGGALGAQAGEARAASSSRTKL